MKRNDIRQKLTAAGVEDDKLDELVNYVMDENGKDINTAKNTLNAELEEAKKENESLKASNSELTTKNDSYKDYEELKQFKAEYLANQEKKQKAEFLKAKGCKHPDLMINQIDWSKAQYDDKNNTYTGIDEAVDSLKENYKDMFESQEKNIIPRMGGNSYYNDQAGNGKPSESPFMKRYKETHPDIKF